MKLKILLLFLLSLCLIKCSKDGENIEQIQGKYKVYLTKELKLLKVEYYVSYGLDYIKTFTYKDNLVKIITSGLGFDSRSTYYLNDKGLADSCIDSSYYNDLRITFSKFQYDVNGYCIVRNNMTALAFVSTYKYPSTDSITYENKYTFENGNQISESWIPFFNEKNTIILNNWYRVSGGWIPVYNKQNLNTRYSTYTNLKSNVDIRYWEGDFCGKKSANLIKSWKGNYESSAYDYILNAEGFVTQRQELYSYGTRKARFIVKYEYIFE
jgi:hypothetical protein